MAPQLILTRGRSRRLDMRWMVRASRVLPTPDSPVMSTTAFTAATFTALASTSSMALEDLTTMSVSAASYCSCSISD